MLRLIFPLLLLFLSIAAYEYKGNDISTKVCDNPAIPTTDISYCSIVDWKSASVYSTVNYSHFETDDNDPWSNEEKDNYARSIGSYIKNSHHVSSSCASIIRTWACINVFAECPYYSTESPGTAYFKPCKTACKQVHDFCGKFNIIEPDCDDYPDVNCQVYAPSGYFYLALENGPYDSIPIIYGVCLACWVIMAILWNYLTFVTYNERCIVFCRAVSSIPVIKCIVLMFGTSFWGTCIEWDMCSFWIGVSFVNTHLVYETASITVFILIAKGWTIMRDVFDPAEWRTIILSVSAFYMANSITLVLKSTVLTTSGYWLANALIYGAIYVYILTATLNNLAIIKKELSYFKPDMPEPIVSPLKQKYLMYQIFLLFVFVTILCEIFAHAIADYKHTMWKVLLLYEGFNVIIFFTIGFMFQPQQFSPFFFITSLGSYDNEIENTRQLPVINVSSEKNKSDDNYLDEIELQRLLDGSSLIHGLNNRDTDSLFYSRYTGNSKVIVVENPDKVLSLGIASTKSNAAFDANVLPINRGSNQQTYIRNVRDNNDYTPTSASTGGTLTMTATRQSNQYSNIQPLSIARTDRNGRDRDVLSLFE